MSTAFSYQARFVASRVPVLVKGYRLKCYEMFHDAARWKEASIGTDGWPGLLGKCLSPTEDADEHKCGFAILHHARDGTYLLASRWFGGNMLKHEVFMVQGPAGAARLESIAASRIVACVWELEVIKFERDAWVRTAMAGLGKPESLDAYFAAQMSGWV